MRAWQKLVRYSKQNKLVQVALALNIFTIENYCNTRTDDAYLYIIFYNI